MNLIGESRTVADTSAASLCFARALLALNVSELLGTRVCSELGLTITLTPNIVARLVEICGGVEALPEGALMLRSPALAAPNASTRLFTLWAQARTLIEERARLEKLFASTMRPPINEIKVIAATLSEAPAFLPSVFSGAYRQARKHYRRMSRGRKANRETMIREMDELLRHLAALKNFLEDPALVHFFGTAADGLQSPFAAALALIDWAKKASTSLRGLGEGGRDVMDALWSAPTDSWTEASAAVTADTSGHEAATALGATLGDAAKWTGAADASWRDSSFSSVRDQLESFKSTASAAHAVGVDAEGPDDTLLVELQRRLVLVEGAWAADKTLELHAATFRELGLALPRSGSVANDSDRLSSVRGALEYLAQFHGTAFPTDLVDWLASNDPRVRIPKLQVSAKELDAKIANALDTEAKFVAAGGVDQLLWYGGSPEKTSLAVRLRRFDRAINAGGTLGRVVTWLRMRATVLRSSMPQGVSLLESGAMSGALLPEAYSYFLTRTLAELVLRERPELDEFSGEIHETRRAQFAALDQAFIDLTQKAVAHRASHSPRVHGVGYGPVKDLTEQSLIEHEIGKTRRHIPIREMFRRAGRAIQALKPCIMMGPQAVAQYLPPGLFHFDLIVMDEASQMRPEDALGAVARGSQLVVVGDPKQLGPSSFFDVQSADEDEIDEAAAQLAAQSAGAEEVPRGASVLERSESILLAAARRYPMRMLKWHYRSRYPQLISFSNQEFYSGDLILFPHPGTELSADGVNFRAVEGALYSSSINRREAEVIVQAVRDHAAKHPERTLLVVTMNQPQREVVDSLIQEAEKDDPQLAEFRGRHDGTLEPFGVKNLENVQGDERDVIFVSATYGPNDHGVVAQNFGPVNTTGGERRLNVLFTRAKYRLDVFCSFDPASLRVTESSPRGLCVFRDYLRYAKDGTLAGGRFTDREPDSDFEIEVARAVRAQGYDVHAQIGVAGYFLDMAVVDPRYPGRYLLAIECDGATYHSAKSARDRDRLRQSVLESLGWTVHRIWSTDWFRDPRGETAKVLRRITRLVA